MTPRAPAPAPAHISDAGSESAKTRIFTTGQHELFAVWLVNSTLIWLKGVLFLISGTLAAGLILLESPKLRTLALLILTIWSFARFYYFAFYVVERWLEPSYRVSGLCSLLVWLFHAREGRKSHGKSRRLSEM